MSDLNKKKYGVRDILRITSVAAIYVVLTLVFNFISYGDIQFRIAEILMILCFFRKDYIISVAVGCAIANIFSPLGYIDVIFGTTATILAGVAMGFSKNLFISCLYPAIFNGIVIGFELYLIMEYPLLISIIGVAVGEIVVLIVGYFVFKKLQKNKYFLELIVANQNIEDI